MEPRYICSENIYLILAGSILETYTGKYVDIASDMGRQAAASRVQICQCQGCTTRKKAAEASVAASGTQAG